jgi:hypothetical protein
VTTTSETVSDVTTTSETVSDVTTTSATVSEVTTTSETVSDVTTTSETVSDVTTTSETVSDVTTTSSDPTVTTTTTEPTNVKVVTSYSISYEKPTRVNYWSHDPRTFKENGGLKGLAVNITLSKFYVNENNQFCDKDGNVIGTAVYDPNGAIPAGIEAFEVKTLDATAYTHTLESEDSAKKVWENEIIAQFGENYTTVQELNAKHANKYTLKAYFFPSEQNDPDFLALNNGEALEMGEFEIYIGVKGDVDLDNQVTANDAQAVLVYYTEKYVTKKKDIYLCSDKEMGDVDQLRYYLGDVKYKDLAGNVMNPTELAADDAQMILVYYTEKYVTKHANTTWESVVGYDLLDSFYGGVTEN